MTTKSPLNKNVIIVPVVALLVGIAAVNWIKTPAEHAADISSNGEPVNLNSEMNNLEVETPEKLDSVERLLDGLLRRLEEKPDDVKGWVLLAKSYHHLQRWDEASIAFEKAKALGYSGEMPSLTQSSSSLSTSVHSPHASRGAGNTDVLSTYVEQAIKDSESKPHSASDKAGIKLSVALDPKLVEQISQDSAVYIFARPVKSSGENKAVPPLAVVRKQARDFPLQIVLDDSMAMIPGKTISSVEQIVVGARVSKSGSPIKQLGDVEKVSEPVPSDYNQTLALVIGQGDQNAKVN